jgi:hypothetical protein
MYCNMGRKERREAQRELERLKKRLEKETPKVSLARRLLKNVWAVVGVAALLLGLLRTLLAFLPHVSIEPQITLNPVNPYTTQFNIKNETIFDVHHVNAVCWPRNMASENGFSVVSFGPLPNVHHEIPLLGAGLSSTVDCPPVLGGIGSYSGTVADANLEILVSYRPSWWPFQREERYPFATRVDVKGAVHWVHITPYDERPFDEIVGKRN